MTTNSNDYMRQNTVLRMVLSLSNLLHIARFLPEESIKNLI